MVIIRGDLDQVEPHNSPALYQPIQQFQHLIVQKPP
ncbi:hypothetical protein SAMN05444358_11182 [Ruegeria halocynthiae]|uniref:Uncharacterized protein n=1 Tax=Ruegeria halocynthiae TaxID=985054 RepID=A0A1H3EKN6_9RHOB|nr:hypothetical protein SAMN05444358_11182 [Ruegeria halocynthiae]